MPIRTSKTIIRRERPTWQVVGVVVGVATLVVGTIAILITKRQVTADPLSLEIRCTSMDGGAIAGATYDATYVVRSSTDRRVGLGMSLVDERHVVTPIGHLDVQELPIKAGTTKSSMSIQIPESTPTGRYTLTGGVWSANQVGVAGDPLGTSSCNIDIKSAQAAPPLPPTSGQVPNPLPSSTTRPPLARGSVSMTCTVAPAVSAGALVTITYQVHSAQAGSVFVGAGLYDERKGGSFDGPHDVIVGVVAGDSTITRLFQVPSKLAAGSYTMSSSFWTPGAVGQGDALYSADCATTKIV